VTIPLGKPDLPLTVAIRNRFVPYATDVALPDAPAALTATTVELGSDATLTATGTEALAANEVSPA
jgi:hypothetical protein